MVAYALVGMRGQNLLVNGRFESVTTGWSASGSPTTFEVSNGRARVVATGGTKGFSHGTQLSLMLGKKYRISFDYEVISGSFNVTKTGMTAISALTGLGSYVGYFMESDGAARTFNILTNDAGSNEFYIDNIKLQRAF
jgi:hypothetical protein